MTILIIGSSSMVGSRVAELLAPHFSLEYADKTMDEANHAWTALDITDKANGNNVISKSKADIIVQFAAYTDVDKAEEDRGNTDGLVWKINVEGTEYLASACKDHGKKLIYISTDYVFKGDEGPYSEEDEPMTTADEGSWYGWSKRQGEMIIQDLFGSEATIVRLAYPFRAKYDLKPDFVRKLIKRFQGCTLHPMFMDQIISPVFVDDVAVALRAIIEKGEPGIWHAVGSSMLSPYEAAQLVAKTFGFDASAVNEGSLENYLSEHPEAKLRYPKNSSLKNDKINALLSRYNAKMHTFEESLQIVKEQMQ